jgi:N-acetyl-gamma-glutamyl-phosphate reductase
MPIKVAVLGGSGYTAAEAINILLRHPQAEIVAVTSRKGDKDATPLVSDLHPRFASRIDLRCQPFDVEKLRAAGVQCAFGCLPHGVSMETIPQLVAAGIRVIDLSADYRLRDPNEYAKWYHHSHADVSNLAKAVYGLPEVYGDHLRAAALVANPGCYPQTAILGLAPLVAGKLIDLRDILIDSKSGVSGGGRSPSLTFHFPECNESVAAYGVGTHRHTPEIEQTLADLAGEAVEVIFTPHLIPMDRGIFTTIYAKPGQSLTQEQLLSLYREYYQDAPFVRVVDRLPATKDSVYTNYLDVTVRLVRGRVLVFACEDNLVRGAAGVAVQNFNLMYGFPETIGLV